MAENEREAKKEEEEKKKNRQKEMDAVEQNSSWWSFGNVSTPSRVEGWLRQDGVRWSVARRSVIILKNLSPPPAVTYLIFAFRIAKGR